MPLQPTEKIWMNGELIDWHDAKIHVLTHSLHYGGAAFEGIRAYETDRGPAIFRLHEHMQRLLRTAKIIAMDVPYTVDELCAAACNVVRASGLPSAYIRPIVYLGYGEMGLNPLPCKVEVAIACWPWGSYLGDEGVKHGIRACISSWKRHDPNIIPPAAKVAGGYINSSMAKIEAMRAGYDEAILLNGQGYVAEGTGENIFVVRNRIMYTPPTSAGALEGVTRDAVIKIARELGHDVREENILRSDLYTADEMFVVGTAAEVVPVRSVDDREIGEPGPITQSIQVTYHDAVRGKLERHAHWLTHING